jgi:hypothetical protein
MPLCHRVWVRQDSLRPCSPPAARAGANDSLERASWRAFHPDDPGDDFGGVDWHANLQAEPLYRRDLDVVAEAPSGEIAALCTVWYGDVVRSAVCVLLRARFPLALPMPRFNSLSHDRRQLVPRHFTQRVGDGLVELELASFGVGGVE